MASTIKVDKIEGSTGSTITIPTGQTFTVTDGIPVSGGGTGLTSFTAGDVLYATGTTTLAKLAKGTAEQIISMNSGATAPEWTTAAPTAGGTGQTTWATGDLLYANGSNTLTKLTKPGSTLFLQMTSGGVPSWAAAGGGAMTYLATETDTNVSALSLDGYFTSDYDVYKYFFNGTAATANTDTGFRFRQGDADVTASNYRSICGGAYRNSGGQGTVQVGAWDSSYIYLSSGDNTNNIKYPVNVEVTLYNPLATDRYKECNINSVGWDSGTDPTLIRSFMGSGYYHADDTTALSGASFFYDGGNITGTVQLYGIKNS